MGNIKLSEKIDNELIDNSEKIENELNNLFVSIQYNLAKYITCNVNS